MTEGEILSKLKESIIQGRIKDTEALVNEAIGMGMSPEEIINKGMVEGISVVGEKFASKEFFLPELMMSGKAMKAGVDVLGPHMLVGGKKKKGTVILGTVKGDSHNIGKNLVGIYLKAAGFDVIDLGEDVPAERFVKAAIDHQAHIIGFSVFCSACTGEGLKIEQALRAAGIRDRVRTTAGGCVLTAEDAEKMGTDKFGKDAFEAVEICQTFMTSLGGGN
jgi:5-methyltetrahydrofolate--homocysteine methyltransferase